jgi:hypothetical protein
MITRLLLMLLLAVSAGSLLAQTHYTPLQPGHTGDYFDPSNVGEGILLTVFDNAERSIFGNVLLIQPGVYAPISLAGDWYTSWRNECRDYELLVYTRTAVNTEGIVIGSAWFRPVDRKFTVLANHESGPILRQWTLTQFSKPAGPVGVCNYTSPLHPAPTKSVWCYDENPPASIPDWCDVY